MARLDVSSAAAYTVCGATYGTGSEFCDDGGTLAGIGVGD